MPINSFDPTKNPYHLAYLIDTLCTVLRQENMAFILAVQYQGKEIRLSHYSDSTATLNTLCRVVVEELEAAS